MKEYVRFVRQLAEHFQCDPATPTENPLRECFLFLRQHKPYSRSPMKMANHSRNHRACPQCGHAATAQWQRVLALRLETVAPGLAPAAAPATLPRLPETDDPHRPAGSRPAALTPCTPQHVFGPSYPADFQTPNGANARLCPQPVMKLRCGLLPEGPLVQKSPPTSIGSPRHTPSLPIRSPATSPKASRSPPTPQKQKTRRLRRARSTPDSIDAPRRAPVNAIFVR